jgi:hypothetical protein
MLLKNLNDYWKINWQGNAFCTIIEFPHLSSRIDVSWFLFFAEFQFYEKCKILLSFLNKLKQFWMEFCTKQHNQ